MLNIDDARPTAHQLLDHLDAFERFCMGEGNLSTSDYRAINEELSVGAVLLIGKRRFRRDNYGKKIFWQGLDSRVYDLGYCHDAKIMRDYPGFNAVRSRALDGGFVESTRIEPCRIGRGQISIVTTYDGTQGIGPDYRTALRNAALKMHLKSRFNFAAMANLFWRKFWGHA
ncbi:MAG: hypothetical protein GC137_09270 [Alphaproteobacteria bacterium]|nr:hypothetical protein [Alphaproteobacteria bacterium]